MKCFICDKSAEYVFEGISICYDHFVQRVRKEIYLDDCICAPDSEKRFSTCGFPCKAQWHWGDEVTYFKRKHRLSP